MHLVVSNDISEATCHFDRYIFMNAKKHFFIVPIFKSGASLINYRPISTMSSIPKVFEKKAQITSLFYDIIKESMDLSRVNYQLSICLYIGCSC